LSGHVQVNIVTEMKRNGDWWLRLTGVVLFAAALTLAVSTPLGWPSVAAYALLAMGGTALVSLASLCWIAHRA
jgi:uncharacterized membrane protein HdeD (DUF308 family)